MSTDVTVAVLGFFTLIIGGFSTVLWFLFRKLYEDCEVNKDSLYKHELHCAKEYITRNDFSVVVTKLDEIQQSLKAACENFRDRLDKKRDKNDTAH